MLKFPYDFCGDAKANKMVKEYYNNRLIRLMDEHMLMFAEKGYEDIKENNEKFAEYTDMFFPDRFPTEQETAVFLGLFALLKAEEEFVPKLVMEYLLDAMISAQIELCRETGTSTVEPMPERDYILEKLRESKAEEDTETPEEKLERIEDIANYEHIIFWDTDFLLLNDYTADELRSSEANKLLGIVYN